MYRYLSTMIVLLLVTITGCDTLEISCRFNEGKPVDYENASEINMKTAETQSSNEKHYIVDLEKFINNEEMADNLIKTVYTDDELKNIDPRINKIIEDNIVECVREINDSIYYVVLKSSAKYLFLIYDFENEPIYPVSIFFSDSELKSIDFEDLTIGTSNITNVKKIDKYGVYSSSISSVPFSSTHYTIDGYKFTIQYSVDNLYTVEHIKKSEKIYPINEMLLPMDYSMCWKPLREEPFGERQVV